MPQRKIRELCERATAIQASSQDLLKLIEKDGQDIAARRPKSKDVKKSAESREAQRRFAEAKEHYTEIELLHKRVLHQCEAVGMSSEAVDLGESVSKNVDQMRLHLDELIALWRTQSVISSIVRDADAARDSEVTVMSTLLNDAHSWVTHYSNVRMTVTVFLMTVSVGIITAKWDQWTGPMLWMAAVIWCIAAAFLWTMTTLEIEKHKIYTCYLNKLLPRVNVSSRANALERSTDRPTRIFVIATIGFFVLVGYCFSQINHAPQTRKIELPKGSRLLLPDGSRFEAAPVRGSERSPGERGTSVPR